MHSSTLSIEGYTGGKLSKPSFAILYGAVTKHAKVTGTVKSPGCYFIEQLKRLLELCPQLESQPQNWCYQQNLPSEVQQLSLGEG